MNCQIENIFVSVKHLQKHLMFIVQIELQRDIELSARYISHNKR